ncbi:MAG TPA: hypothetical protein VHO24_13950, partial [Opitutaceae bacterium]|nr:hypothetical protein [Opitutaceae bacterium]
MNAPETIRTETHSRLPADFSAEQKDEFAEFIIAGGEVAPEGLRERLESALRLTFMYAQGKALCGVAALKQQSEEYRGKIFQKAEASDPAANFPYELGWIVVQKELRGHRLSGRLVDTALKMIEKAGSYATVRLDNEPMRRTLIRYGFRPEGTHFRSTRGPYDLALYVKDGEFPPSYLSPEFKVRGQFHGSPARFSSFSSHGLRSLGFHFGDIAQALDFAKESGFVYKADLT